jgi:hypothetical protein
VLLSAVGRRSRKEEEAEEEEVELLSGVSPDQVISYNAQAYIMNLMSKFL